MTGSHAIMGWSKTRTLVALSSGESKLYATLRAAVETLGVISMYKGYGLHMSREMWGDARAAL